MKSPLRPVDQDAIDSAMTLLTTVRIGALATLDPAGHPHVTRIAHAWINGPVTLISDLSDHTNHLRTDPRASLLLGEPGERGDPLNHPRITLVGHMEFVEKTLREQWLTQHPKSKLYVDFADFAFARLFIDVAHLNGGFGKAYRLTPQDLGL